MPQSGAAQTRHQPNGRAHAGHRRPAVNHHVHVRGSDAAPSQETDSREHVGRVQFERNKPGEQRAEQEPGDRGGVEHQHRHARRCIDQSALDLLGLARRHIGCAIAVGAFNGTSAVIQNIFSSRIQIRSNGVFRSGSWSSGRRFALQWVVSGVFPGPADSGAGAGESEPAKPMRPVAFAEAPAAA